MAIDRCLFMVIVGYLFVVIDGCLFMAIDGYCCLLMVIIE
jgi:hypothetical protein